MHKKLLVAVTATAIATTLSGCSFFYPHLNESPSPSTTASSTETASASPTVTTPPVLKNVVVEFLDISVDIDGGVQAIAHVLNTNETDGTCTLTVTSAGESKSISAKAEPNITDTQCFPLTLPVAGLTPGDATAKVTYVSGKSKGTSVITSIVIP